MTGAVPIAVAPSPVPEVVEAIHRAGGRVVTPAQAPVGLVWLGDNPGDLRRLLERAPTVRWVQLPAAGVEPYLGLMGDGRVWSCARDVYGQEVAEHALMLALACLKDAAASTGSGSWSPRPTVLLRGADVVIVGGGAIARALLELLRPFAVSATVLRRSAAPLGRGEVRVLGPDALDEVLPAARVVFVAAPLTGATRGLVDRRRLRLMRDDACLVNVARGELVVTDDLVQALRQGWIGGAGLDVTDPEPLPAGHPLWGLPRCLVTAHSAADLAGVMPAFARLVEGNVRRLVAGTSPHGLVDRDAGY